MVNVARIYRDPILTGDDFSFSNQVKNHFPFNQRETSYFAFARVALLEGIQRLGLKEGDEVLIPNYVCNVVLAPLHYLKIKAKFYSLDSQLKPDWENIRGQIDSRTKAFLMINYFGFPNDLETAQKLCREHNLFFIEDNTQGFLSYRGDQPLGSFGDISIFSFRKTIPVSFGAALVENSPNKINNHKGFPYRFWPSHSIKFLAKSFLKPVLSKAVSSNALLPEEKDLGIDMKQDAQEEFEIEKYFVKLSPIEWFMLEHLDIVTNRKQRIKNYELWLNYFRSHDDSNVKVLMPELLSGTVPFVFPILAENRAEFIQNYWRRGVECYPWPFLPKDSDETFFSSRLVCLPLSQTQALESILNGWSS